MDIVESENVSVELGDMRLTSDNAAVEGHGTVGLDIPNCESIATIVQERVENSSYLERLKLDLGENVLTFMAICVAAYVGSFIRVGISYYRIWKTETNYVSDVVMI